MRVQTIECSDALKMQFLSLVKYLDEYESVLAELNGMINEHERVQCKNNHTKTKRFFNKTKAFIRYDCHKRMQNSIFEYRRLINTPDKYAGMFDLVDMNNHLISLLPDIGVSIRRYINKCEKAREEEDAQAEEEEEEWHESAGDDDDDEEEDEEDEEEDEDEANKKDCAGDSLKIPSFTEFVANNIEYEKENKKRKSSGGGGDNDNVGDEEEVKVERKPTKGYESFTKGIDALNRYLLKRVDEEDTLDELVKERIMKWINKRQAKYILIFSDVDKLLAQHKAGECYAQFHSYIQFNLGKLVTVCESYHQKLTELLYSTTIKRKKKRKKVKILPESMADVFSEIVDLKRALESTKLTIKKCNNEHGSSKSHASTSGVEEES